MKWKNRIAILVTFTLACLSAHTSAQQTPRYRWSFSAEGDAPYPTAKIPQSVLRKLEEDEQVQETIAEEGGFQKVHLRRWFQAVKVPLTSTGECDLVVKGVGPILGANVTTFWVFRVKGGKATMLLKVSAHDLDIAAVSQNGYLGIDAASSTASTVSITSFVMKNGSYRAVKESTSLTR